MTRTVHIIEATWQFIIVLTFHTVHAMIEQQPIFTLQPFDVGPLYSGARGILQCTASGTPTVSYKWMKDGRFVTKHNSANGGVYLISQADRFNDVGEYQCIAENSLGAVLSNKARLTVAYMDQLKTSYPTEIRVKKGHAAVIKMPKMFDAYPKPIIEWFAGGALIEPNAKFAITKDFDLVVLRADKADEKSYYVEARNIHTGGELRSKDIRLYVTDNEKNSFYQADNSYNSYLQSYTGYDTDDEDIDLEFVVKPVDSTAKLNENLVKFDCIVNSRRAPLDQLEINWYKDGILIDFIKTKYHLSARSLEIISVTDQDAGTYSCSVKYNYLGSKNYDDNKKEIQLNASAKFDVYIKPTFKNQPENLIETDYGKEVSFKCDGISNPPANITWYKNAKLIEFRKHSNFHVQESNTKLVISDVAKEDEGIYQCFLSNQAGSVSAATLVRIISFAPEFNSQIHNETMYSDSDAVLSCGEVSGSPKPTITWSKLDSYSFEPISLQPHSKHSSSNRFPFTYIPNSYYQTNGQLIINNVNSKSQGWYKCEATNLLGTVTAKMFLQIKKKTEIIEPPMNISVTKGQSAIFKCTVSKERDVDIDLKWTFNNILLDLSPNDHIGNSNLKLYSNGTLQILEAKNTDIGAYECLVTSIRNNLAGNDSRKAYLNVVELPYSPINLQSHLNPSQSRSVNLTWQPSFNGNSQIMKYIVQARITTSLDLLLLQQQQQQYEQPSMANSMSSQHDWFVIKDNIYRSVLEHTATRTSSSVKYWTLINGLKPALSYEFKISAVNGIGEGMPSRPSNNITIPEEVPSQAPQSLQTNLIGSKAISLSWQLPIMQSWNGRLKGYRLAYSLSYPNSSWKFLQVNDPTVTSANLTDLIVWEMYLVKICAFNSKGVGKYSEPIKVRTKEGIPIRAPLNFQANAINSTCIQMAWSEPPPQFVNGVIKGYKLLFNEKVNKTRQQTHVVSQNELKTSQTNYGTYSGEHEYTLCGLAKFTTYSFSILCFTNSGDGPGTQPIQLRTLEDTPGEISRIYFNNVYDTSLDIEWQPPRHPNGKILSYIISYRSLKDSTNSSRFEQIILDSSQNNFTLKNLKQQTEYLIGIKAKTKAGEGQIKYTQIKSGVPPELPEPPKAIVLRTIGNTFADIEFIPGSTGKTSINKWIVEALTVHNSNDYYAYANNAAAFETIFKWHRVFEQSNAPNATKLTVQNLKPFTNYTLRMFARNVKGLSAPSVPTELFQTKPDVPSVTPAYLGARLKTLYSNTTLPSDINLLIKWSPIPTSKWNGIPYGYVIRVDPCHHEGSLPQRTVKIPFSKLKETRFLLKGLRSFQCYVIKMCAWNNVGYGPWSDKTFRIEHTSESRPSIGPSNVNLYSINSSCIKVVWSKMKPNTTSGILIGYSITYSPETNSTRKSIFISNNSNRLLIDNTNKKITESLIQSIYLTGLLSFTNYNVEISACTRAGCGITSSPVSLRTSEYLPSKPLKVHFKHVNQTSVQINWQPPKYPNGILNTYRIRYILKDQFNDNKPNAQQKWSTLFTKSANSSTGEYSLNVNGLVKREYYLFEITANNSAEMGWGKAATSIVYTIASLTRQRPNPPSKPVISKSSIKNNELTISWNSGSDNYSPLRFFTIQMTEVTGKNSSEWKNVVARFPVNSNDISHRVQIDGNDQNGKPILKSNGFTYKFRISGTNDVGTSQFSLVSDLVRTKQTAPKYQPLFLTAKPLSSSKLCLTWYEQINLNDKSMQDLLLKFKLIYRRVFMPQELAGINSVEIQLNHKATRKELYKMTDQNLPEDVHRIISKIGSEFSLLKHQFILESQFTTNGTYELKLCGINQIGIGKCSYTQSLVYMEDTLPALISINETSGAVASNQLIQNIETLSSTELNLTWSRPSSELIKGELYAYKVVYFVNKSPLSARKFLANQKLIHEVRKHVKESNFDSLGLDQYESEANDDYYNYPAGRLRRDLKEKGIEKFHSLIVEPSRTNILINNLQPFTPYSIFIQLINQAGESSSPLTYLTNNITSPDAQQTIFTTQIHSAKTYQSIPSKPAKLIFSYVSYTFLNLSWLEPQQPNGKILAYEVLYENVPDKKSLSGFKTIIRQEIITGLDQALHTIHITNLAPKVEYKFKVRCRTAIGWSQYSERSVTTGPQHKEIQLTSDQNNDIKIGSPLAPSRPMFVDLNETHGSLTWKPYSDNQELFIIEIKYFFIAPESINTDNYLLMDTKALQTSTRLPVGNSSDVPNFLVFAYTNATTLVINKHVQLTQSPLFMFRVLSFNFIGISEPSPTSEIVHVKTDSSHRVASDFWSNWWFLVIIALSSFTLVIIIILIMCLRGKNKKFLIKRDTKIRNTIKMMKMNQNAINGTGADPSKTSTIQTNLRLENLLDNLTGTDSIDLSMHDNLGQYLTSGRNNKNGSNYYMAAGSNAQLILTDTTTDSNYGVSNHNQLVYDMRKSKRGGGGHPASQGTVKTATYCSPNGTLSRVNIVTNNNDAEQLNGELQQQQEANGCNTLGKQMNQRHMNGILNGFFQAQAQPNDYSSSGQIGQLINNSLRSSKHGNHYLLPCNTNAAFDNTDSSSSEPQSQNSELTNIMPPPAVPAQFYYGQQNYASFNSSTTPRLQSNRNGNAVPVIRLDSNGNSVRAIQTMSNIYSDDTPQQDNSSNMYDRNTIANYSNRKIYTTSSFGRQPEIASKGGIPQTLQKQQQELQQKHSVINNAESSVEPPGTFQDRRNSQINSNYLSSRNKLNMNTYYEHQQIYQMQQPTYHTHIAQNIGSNEIQSQISPPPPPPPPPAPPTLPEQVPQLPQLPKNLPPVRPPPEVHPPQPPLIQSPEPKSAANISISLKSGDRVVMNNQAGSRKPLTGFSSFV